QYSHRLLWVTGDIGTGKSLLLTAATSELYSGLATDKSSMILCHVSCSCEGLGALTMATIMRSLITEILAKTPSLAKHLVDTYKSTGRTFFDGPNDFYALSGLFFDMIQDNDFADAYFVIDGIDEC
ncbi:hypothetical protein TRIATDRAFT_186083, partial [Trichoderma atroviride IMI 206040]